jgi:hypothetical protein
LGDEGFVKTMMVTRRVLRQKEVTISMADGRYAKNEIILHLTGLDPDYDLNQAVQEAANGMTIMQEKNPLLPGPSPKSKALIDKTMKAGEARAKSEGEEE